MKILIVYAHPNKKSFNHAELEHIKSGLDQSGEHTYQIVDLYEEQFNPVLTFNENKRRVDLVNDPEMKKYRDLVQEANHLIFIYPIWWYGPPAILKGFIDRVLVKGFAYTYEGFLPKGLLSGKTAWVVYTLDSPSWFVTFFRHQAEWMIMKRAILKFCGFRKIRRLMFAGLKNSSLKKRETWLNYLEQESKKL